MGTDILIFERDTVISEDIAEISAEVDPSASLTTARTVADAVSVLMSACPAPRIAILRATEAELKLLLAEPVVARGQAILIAIHEGIGAPVPQNVLLIDQPYTGESLRAALRAALTLRVKMMELPPERSV